MDEHLLLAFPALVLLTGLWRPQVGLAVLAAGLPLFGAPPTGPYLGALDLAGLCALVVALRARADNTTGRGESSNCLQWPLYAWIAVTLASLLPPLYRPPSWQPEVLLSLLRSLPYTDALSPFFNLRMAQRSLIGLALFWAYRRVFRGRSIRPVGLGLGVGLGYVVVLGLLEYIELIDLSGYRTIGAELYDFRLHSLFFHSGWLAEYLILATPFALAAMYSQGPGAWRLAGHALLSLTATSLLLTQQRGAWLTAIVQFGFVLLLPGALRLRKRQLIGVLLATVFASTLVLVTTSQHRPQIVDSLQVRLGATGRDLSGRLTVWQNSLQLGKQTRFLGTGLGTFATTYEQSFPCGSNKHCWLTAHSVYVQTAIERGALGLLALLLLGWASTRCLLVFPGCGRDRYGPDGPGILGVGLATSMVGLAVYGLVQHIFFLQNIEWLCWILLAAVSLVGSSDSVTRVRQAAKVLMILALASLPLRWLAAAPSSVAPSEFGFHRAEYLADGRVVNWTTPEAARPIPWEGEILLVELVDGHPSDSARALEVTLTAGGIERWHGPVGPHWTQAVVDVGEAEKEWLVLQVAAQPTFRPFAAYRRHPELAPSRDIRSLGVVVGRINWQRFLLHNRTVNGRESVRSEHFPVRAGNLGAGDFVVASDATLEIIAPSVTLVNGFRVAGDLTILTIHLPRREPE